MTPMLASDTYKLEIISQFTTSGILQKPNTALFDDELVVQ